MTAKTEPPRKGSVDALEHTMAELGVEHMVGQSIKLADHRQWTIVLITDEAKVWTGEGSSMAEAAREALVKLGRWRKSL